MHPGRALSPNRAAWKLPSEWLRGAQTVRLVYERLADGINNI